MKLCVIFNSVRCGYLNQAIKVMDVQHISSQLWKHYLQVNIINVNESNIIAINCFFCAIFTKFDFLIPIPLDSNVVDL